LQQVKSKQHKIQKIYILKKNKKIFTIIFLFLIYIKKKKKKECVKGKWLDRDFGVGPGVGVEAVGVQDGFLCGQRGPVRGWTRNTRLFALGTVQLKQKEYVEKRKSKSDPSHFSYLLPWFFGLVGILAFLAKD